ncbi:hypothetical protein LCL96_15255 [Rossellomorea aquimaris]|uniref:hypothetical protein n=1 Tax=Rossellomorea aquimaris TaxID=189382 RepID=UPI001CD818A3|nr:hypothetical protein [Rossellomorea aquimaris]MCA1060295.1 hypothetical protein [Rossellomorea aquimaris]
MKRRIGKRVCITKGKSAKWGRIIKVADPTHYIVRFEDDRKEWVRKSDVEFFEIMTGE